MKSASTSVVTMKTSSAVLLVLFILVIYVLSLFLVESGKTVSLKDSLAKRRRNSIVVAARKKLRTVAPKSERRISIVGSRRRRYGNSYDDDEDEYDEDWDYDEYEESGSRSYLRGRQGDPYKRKKRFYQLEVGCIKGYYCCENPLCRPYCSLCNDPPSGYGATGYGSGGRGGYGYHRGYGGYGHRGGGYRKKKRKKVCKKGKDEDMNGICDKDEDPEEKNPQDGSTTASTTTTTATTTTTEEDLSEVMAQGGSDETDTETETDEDLEEVMAQGGRDDMEGEGGDATTEAGQTGQLEFTHHIYEEYQPTVPVESKPPIILQTIPHYSVANYFSLSKHHHPNLPPPPPPPPPSPRPVHHHHRHHTSHHVTHNVGGGPVHPHPGHHAHHQHTSVSHGVGGGFTGPGGLITGPGGGPGISGPGPGLIPGGTLAPGRIPTPGVPPPLPHHHSGGRHHFHHSSTAGPNVFAPHGLNPIPDGPFPLDIPPRQFHPMGASSSESLVKYGEGEENSEGEDDKKGNGLFYGDIQAIIRGGRPTASSSLPPLPPRQQSPRASPSSTLFDEQELSNLVSSSGGSLPVLNAGTPPSTSSPMVFNGGMSDAAGLSALGGPGGPGGGAGNPFMYNVPLPQTIIYDQNSKPDYTPTQPPQPLLKYHLIRHSYPAKPDQEYFADIPAFMPGPPYLPKALPSRKYPQVRKPQRPPAAAPPYHPPPPVSATNTYQNGPLQYPPQHYPLQQQHQPHENGSKKKRKKKSGLGALVNNLFG